MRIRSVYIVVLFGEGMEGGSCMNAKQAIPVPDIHVGDPPEFEFSFVFVDFVFLGLFGVCVAAEQVQGVSV